MHESACQDLQPGKHNGVCVLLFSFRALAGGRVRVAYVKQAVVFFRDVFFVVAVYTSRGRNVSFFAAASPKMYRI